MFVLICIFVGIAWLAAIGWLLSMVSIPMTWEGWSYVAFEEICATVIITIVTASVTIFIVFALIELGKHM